METVAFTFTKSKTYKTVFLLIAGGLILLVGLVTIKNRQINKSSSGSSCPQGGYPYGIEGEIYCAQKGKDVCAIACGKGRDCYVLESFPPRVQCGELGNSNTEENCDGEFFETIGQDYCLKDGETICQTACDNDDCTILRSSPPEILCPTR